MNNSPEIHYYRDLFTTIENRLKTYEERYGSEDLFNEALSIYLAHQFEFGCATGSLGTDKTRYLLNVPGNMLLEGVRLSNFLLDAFDPPIYQLKWKYLGNHPVIVFSNEDIYSIWSPYGGRCVLLIDKNKKTLVSPNPFFYNIGNSVADLELPSPTFEFPDLGVSLIHGGTLMSDSIAVNDEPIGIQSPVTRIFSEHGYHDELGPSLSHNYFDTQIIPFDNLVKFWIRLGPFLLMKEVTLLGTDIRVHYTIRTESDMTSLIKLGVTNEVSPTPNEIMIGGTNVLDIQLGTTDYSIMNVDSGAGLNIQPSIIPTNTDVIEAIFAKRLTLFFSHKLHKDRPFEVDVKLTLL